MKIIQISDLHCVEPGTKIGKVDPLKQLKKCVEHINLHHGDAEFCAITGDITDAASPLAYKACKKILDSLLIPYYPIIGNHDLRKPFLQAFPDTPTDTGFIQYTVELDDYSFIFLDTVKENHDHGELCHSRRLWLNSQLENTDPAKPIIIFMHHPPFSVSLPWIDSIMLKNGQAFYEIIKGHRVAHLFFGHIHRPTSGVWRSIPYSSNRSIGHYQIGTHNEQNYDFPMNKESPLYTVISLSDDQIHIDLSDFNNDKIVFQT